MLVNLDTLQLTKDLIAINSVSQQSNAEISDYLEELLQRAAFEVERLAYQDDNGELKVSLIAKKGRGEGGLGFFSHSDTVPGDVGWEPWIPKEENGHLVGRGSCDMKGPLAATIVAGAAVSAVDLQKPLYIVVTADEEVGYGGARQVVAESQLLQANWPQYGVIAEPTQLRPVYAHKGGARINVTAHGRAAHTSTDQGISANFLIAPFLAEMAELVQLFRTDERFMNHEFDPPTNGFNMVIDDGGTKPNVTAAKTVCTLGLRAMPNDNIDIAIGMITDSAQKYNLEVDTYSIGPFYVAPDAAIVQAASSVTHNIPPETVPFGTEAALFIDYLEPVVLGPGNIAQAHTVGEWIDIGELQQAVTAYNKLINIFCL